MTSFTSTFTAFAGHRLLGDYSSVVVECLGHSCCNQHCCCSYQALLQVQNRCLSFCPYRNSSLKLGSHPLIEVQYDGVKHFYLHNLWQDIFCLPISLCHYSCSIHRQYQNQKLLQCCWLLDGLYWAGRSFSITFPLLSSPLAPSYAPFAFPSFHRITLYEVKFFIQL